MALTQLSEALRNVLWLVSAESPQDNDGDENDPCYALIMSPAPLDRSTRGDEDASKWMLANKPVLKRLSSEAVVRV